MNYEPIKLNFQIPKNDNYSIDMNNIYLHLPYDIFNNYQITDIKIKPQYDDNDNLIDEKINKLKKIINDFKRKYKKKKKKPKKKKKAKQFGK